MGQYTEQALAYYGDMIDFYHSLSHLPGFFLLESLDRQQGRYDILSAYPYDVVSKMPASAAMAECTQPQLQFQPRISRSTLPFQGGAIAALSYDYGSLLHRVDNPAVWDMDFPLYFFSYYDWAIVVDHHLQKVTLLAQHQQPDTEGILREIQRLWRARSDSPVAFRVSGLRALSSRASYQQDIASIHAALARGRCYQVNYTQAFHLHSEADPWALYRQIRMSNPVPFAAFMSLEKQKILSFSPERFLRIDPDGRVLTSPIKGSIRRDSNSAIDRMLAQQLLASEKNRAENVMIVDLLRNDLSRICKAGSVQVRRLMEVQSFTAVHHLVSHIEGQLQAEQSSLAALLACFPGGSITGAPKIEAMKMIAELEQRPRGIYCGSIAYFSQHGQVDSNIAIRTLTAQGNQLQLAAGGGIVLDSDWQEEYAECYIKLEAILEAVHAKILT